MVSPGIGPGSSAEFPQVQPLKSATSCLELSHQIDVHVQKFETQDPWVSILR